MKACLIQPPYSSDLSLSDACFEEKLSLLASCDDTADVIVLPEYSDVPWAASTREEILACYEKYHAPLMEACREAAIRCGAAVFVNAWDDTPDGFRNTTWVLDRQGNAAGKYYKRHLPPHEVSVGVDGSYTLRDHEPVIVTLDGIRYAFLTCYDFYFYEAFPKLARARPDVIVGCSLQRTDRHSASEILCRFLAYNTNAYVLRCSVSMDEGSDVCGATMAVAPDGEVLGNLESRRGVLSVEFDPGKKYYKAAGFGNPPAAHWEYVESGRSPWQYLPAGPSVVPTDARMPYPRICAHRGFNTVAPENSMPAFGAAVAMGAEEIEFDLWETADGEIVSIHDANLDRVSDGTGFVWEHTYEELLRYDFGFKAGEEYRGMKILRFEEILKKLGCQTVMNVHVKSRDDVNPLPEDYLKRMIALIRRYDAERHCYFMSGNPAVLGQLSELAPDIARCAGADGDVHGDLVEKALRYRCAKIQLFVPHFRFNPPDYAARQIEKAHARGIRVNFFYADTPEEAEKYLRMGADVILTNDYNRVSRALGRGTEPAHG